MTDKNTLLKFTGDDQLSKPFSDGKYTYFTDGMILLRVPKMSEYVYQNDSYIEGIITGIKEAFYSCSTDTLWVETENIPEEVVIQKEKCGYCEGSGKVSSCEECDGDGSVYFKNDHHNYECECRTCRGEGVVPGGNLDCEDCGGVGFHEIDHPIAFGNDKRLGLNGKLVNKLHDLEGVLVSTTPVRNGFQFTFNGGDGVVMGIMMERGC